MTEEEALTEERMAALGRAEISLAMALSDAALNFGSELRLSAAFLRTFTAGKVSLSWDQATSEIVLSVNK